MNLDDLEMTIEMFFSACISLNQILSPRLCENEIPALVRF